MDIHRAIHKSSVSVLDAIENYRIYPIVPDRFQIEVLRICQKKTTGSQPGAVSSQEAWRRFLDTAALPILEVPSAEFYEQAWQLAQTERLTVHDALYLALALDWNAELWTLDAGLASVFAQYANVYDLRNVLFPY